MEYNKYHQSLVIDCCKDQSKPKPESGNCCPGMHLPSKDNEIEILIRNLIKEVKDLKKSTETRLLCQNKKIDETMVYIKNNLNNSLRELLNSMVESGEIDELIISAVSNEIAILEEKVAQLEVDVEELKRKVDELETE